MYKQGEKKDKAICAVEGVAMDFVLLDKGTWGGCAMSWAATVIGWKRSQGTVRSL